MFPEAAWDDEREIAWTVRFVCRGLAPDERAGGDGRKSHDGPSGCAGAQSEADGPEAW
ncbi:hypothetical protein [Alicyclobacillus cellulosilyticus]|uniref:hypothetical protein n=1 Tax=Alicyclobacillus cellulosilyticus TaxID=1003997 RepID=UPI00166670C2|nr:hypothetical protein [Alicyclobacillus cellulosilyticus]